MCSTGQLADLSLVVLGSFYVELGQIVVWQNWLLRNIPTLCQPNPSVRADGTHRYMSGFFAFAYTQYGL